MSQVIVEYHILREVLFQFLEQNSDFTIQERETLTSAIEETVNIAATEFALALREIQEQFMLSIAHDLKNPVTAAQAGAELILRSNKREITVPLAESMIKSMKKMTEMIEDIHDTNRVKSGHLLLLSLTECDINAIVEDVISDMKIVYGDIFSVISDGTLLGRWNPDALRRIVENMISNAVKYRAHESCVTLKLLDQGQNAVFSVHNPGTAIPVSEQAHLFSTVRWKTSGKTQKGWGLGLVLVKGIVDALHGTIEVESTEDKGTTFTVTLPRQLKSKQDVRSAG